MKYKGLMMVKKKIFKTEKFNTVTDFSPLHLLQKINDMIQCRLDAANQMLNILMLLLCHVMTTKFLEYIHSQRSFPQLSAKMLHEGYGS